jgi:hypothetical protein
MNPKQSPILPTPFWCAETRDAPARILRTDIDTGSASP